MNTSTHYHRTAEIVYITANGVSILACTLATFLVCRSGLYKRVVYRLSLYQVLASLLLATANVLATIVSVNYHKNPPIYSSACSAIGWFILCAQWTKLMLTAWVTFHLFCFAVLLKNQKRLEGLYVVTSLLVPAVVAIVPLVTDTYSVTGNCYISALNDSTHAAFVENIVLWDGPALAVLLAASVAMIVMVTKLVYRACLRFESGDYVFWKALKQLLPLAAFPILFFVFIIPMLVFDVHVAVIPAPNMALELTVLVCIPMWSFTSGVTVIVHISLTKYFENRKMRVNHFQLHESYVKFEDGK